LSQSADEIKFKRKKNYYKYKIVEILIKRFILSARGEDQHRKRRSP
jgi:hypothetical protein